MCVYYIQVCHGNAPTVTKQIQSMIPTSPSVKTEIHIKVSLSQVLVGILVF